MAEKFKNNKIGIKSKSIQPFCHGSTTSFESTSGSGSKTESDEHSIIDEETAGETRLPSSLAISKSGIKSRFSHKSFSHCDIGTAQGSHFDDEWSNTPETFDGSKSETRSIYERTKSTTDSKHESMERTEELESTYDNVSDIESDLFDLPMEGKEEGSSQRSPAKVNQVAEAVRTQNAMRGRGRGRGKGRGSGTGQAVTTWSSEGRATKRNIKDTMESSDEDDTTPLCEF